MNTELVRTVGNFVRAGSSQGGLLPVLGPIATVVAPYLFDYGAKYLEEIMKNNYRVKIGPFSLEPSDASS